MTDVAKIQPWQQHTGVFTPRVIEIGSTTFDFLHAYLDKLPQPKLATQLSDDAALKYQLALLVIAALRTAREIAFSSSKIWLQGHFLLASVGIRMLVELNGQLLWAQKKVLSPLADGLIDVPCERMKKLLFGSKAAAHLMSGEEGPDPINVMEFVRAVEAVRPGAMADYEFLCDSAHPSYIMQSWMLFAAPDHDNWSAAAFAAQVAPMLGRMLDIAEKSLASLESVAEHIMVKAVPAILAETTEKKL